MLSSGVVSVLILCSALLKGVICVPKVIKIGGLFDSSETDRVNEKVFRRAIDKVNELDLLEGTRLMGLTMRVPEHQSFQVQRSVCELIQQGCVAIFGPRSPDTTPIVESVCDAKEIPHIEARWNHKNARGSCSVNLYPDAGVLAASLVDVVRAHSWTHFTLVYYDNDGLYRVKRLLEMYDRKGHTIVLRKLKDDGTGNFRPLLRRIKNSEQTFILIDAPTDILFEVLKQAQQIGLMSSEQDFIINNLDMHTIDMEPFKYSSTNISGIRMLNTSSERLKKTIEEWGDAELDITPDNIKLETVLIYDGVFLLAQSLLNAPIQYDPTSIRVTREDGKDGGGSNPPEDDGNPTSEDGNTEQNGENARKEDPSEHAASGVVEAVRCDNGVAWPHGYSIINDIKSGQLKSALSGNIRFDHQGFRTSFPLELTKLTEDGVVGTGKWSPRERVKFYNEKPAGDFRNTTFRVVIALTPPYGMERESPKPLTGNDRYEGFAVDLIHELSILCGFNYTLEVQADSKGGSYDNNTKKWNGMIGKILYGEADLAITDLTITRARENVVDFTMPFMNLGIAILYKKPKRMPPSLFSFLSPFSMGVWIYVIAAYIGVSVLLFIMARISPYEWTNPYPCIEEPEELENQFSVSNSFWFTIGSLMQQGSEIAPIAVSTRMTAGIWWFFTLIMVSSYTANLAAFLTVENNESPFHDVEGLEGQTKIKYGAKADGSTEKFFQDSTNDVYQRMWVYMKTHYSEVMPGSNEEGVNRVNDNDDYAFLMESTSIEYEIERKCNLTQVGDLLDSKGYGIAMQKNQWFRDKLNFYVLTLQERGKLQALKNKWWKEKGAGTCQEDEKSEDDTGGLTLANVGGVFVVLVFGIFFSIFIAFGEMFYNLWSVSVEKKVSFRRELRQEWDFISRCHGSVKPVRRYDTTSVASSASSVVELPVKAMNGGSRGNLHSVEAATPSAQGTPRNKRSKTVPAFPISLESQGSTSYLVGQGGTKMSDGRGSRNNLAGGLGGQNEKSNRAGGNGVVVPDGGNGGSRKDVHLIGFEPMVATPPLATSATEAATTTGGGGKKKQRRRDVRKSSETDI